MKAKERIAQLERELAEVREELALIERAETMESELAELKRRIATRRPVYPRPIMWQGYQCSCGTWVYLNTYHVCQRWAPQQPWYPIISAAGTSGQLSSSDHVVSYNNVTSILGKGLMSKQTATNTVFGHGDDDPPDMGVVAAV